MNHRSTRSVFALILLSFAVLFALPAASFGQTFRGGISGTITDTTGAAVPGALVKVFSPGTGLTRTVIDQ